MATLVAASALALGCGRIGYDGQQSGDREDSPDAGDLEENADAGDLEENAGASCAKRTAAIGTGEIFLEQVGDQLTRRVASSCSPGSPEFAVVLEADITGTYQFFPASEAGEAFVTVLEGESCTAPEIICEWQGASVHLDAGQTVLLAVEAPGALTSDNVSLLIRSVQPASHDSGARRENE